MSESDRVLLLRLLLLPLLMLALASSSSAPCQDDSGATFQEGDFYYKDGHVQCITSLCLGGREVVARNRCEKPGQCRRRFFPALVCSPGEIVNTCQGNDALCPGSEKCCRTARCVTSCEEPDAPKPGACPYPFLVETGNSNCDVDSDCGDDNRKCCANVYGSTRCAVPQEKPGQCRRRVFPAQVCSPGEIVNTCQGSDAQCPGTQKCCRTARCVTSCEEPDGPKPGSCPSPSDVESGNSNCDVDSDCGDDNKKCCENQDGNTRCAVPGEKPGQCRRRFFPALVCSPGEIVNTCQGSDARCPGTQKCCRTARCVTSCEEPDVPKSGTCPSPSLVEPGSANCDLDSDCGDDNRKCCKNQDGNTRCAVPQEKPGQCRRRFFPALVCSPGEIVNTCQGSDALCPGTQKCCRTARCVTSCEAPDVPKPGTCPSPSLVEPGSANCDLDSDCGDDNRKCCKNQDGNTRCAVPQEKPGQCRRRFFPALVCSPGEIVNTCQGSDALCPGTQKCCRTARCVTSCEAPDAPKPGSCPPPFDIELGNPNCEVDSDCGDGILKCCKNRNGNSRCAVPGEKPGRCRRRLFPAQTCPVLFNPCQGDDAQCPGSQKCCRTERCAFSCEEPDAPKPGTCPSVYGVEPGHSNCDVDSDCGNGDRKCCENREGNTRCAIPQGRCPDTSGVISSCEFIPGVSCEHQTQCSKGKLCCPYGCGKRCLQPAY